MDKNKPYYKEFLAAIIMIFLPILGIISGVCSILFGLEGSYFLSIISGLVSFFNSGYIAVDFYKKYIVPKE